jgi:DNA-binding LytR/AlgR family response regulator
MIKCIIIEDEPLAQEILEHYISKTDGLILLGKYFSAVEAFGFLNSNEVDLMFLDIKMPMVSGLQFVNMLKKPPAFIFTTAYAEYAKDSYDLDALDYLLKPIEYERFLKAVEKFNKRNAIILEEVQFTYFKIDGRQLKIYHRDILYAKSLKDYIKIHTISGSLMVHFTMKDLENLLPNGIFKRIHRSIIINTAHITAYGKNEVIIGNETLPIGKLYKSNMELPK